MFVKLIVAIGCACQTVCAMEMPELVRFLDHQAANTKPESARTIDVYSPADPSEFSGSTPTAMTQADLHEMPSVSTVGNPSAAAAAVQPPPLLGGLKDQRLDYRLGRLAGTAGPADQPASRSGMSTPSYEHEHEQLDGSRSAEGERNIRGAEAHQPLQFDGLNLSPLQDLSGPLDVPDLPPLRSDFANTAFSAPNLPVDLSDIGSDLLPYGTIDWGSPGGTFTGFSRDRKPHGFGTYTDRDGRSFEGTFNDGRVQPGWGIYRRPDGVEIRGNYEPSGYLGQFCFTLYRMDAHVYTYIRVYTCKSRNLFSHLVYAVRLIVKDTPSDPQNTHSLE